MLPNHAGSLRRFAAFTLGLAPVVTYGVLQTTVGPDYETPVAVIFVTHLVMPMVLLLMLARADAVRGLQAGGCRMDVSCYWLSRSGHGGPAVSAAQMGELARLGLELWFDVYLVGS
jgi:hypothetical protein